MKIIKLVSISLLLLASCCTIDINRPPDIKGIDPKVQKLYNDYMALSKLAGIKFDKEVPIGFGDISQSNVVAECFQGDVSRQILISQKHWDNSTKTQRMEILFHELTHCYCGRLHDYKGVEYGHFDTSRVAYYGNNVNGVDGPFYTDDGCPKSMMFPVVLDIECTLAHYNDYVKEMFENCTPW